MANNSILESSEYARARRQFRKYGSLPSDIPLDHYQEIRDACVADAKQGDTLAQQMLKFL